MTRKAKRRAASAAAQTAIERQSPAPLLAASDKAEKPEPFIRDAVTGERLTAASLRGALVIRVPVRDVRAETSRYTGQPTGEESNAPTKLHTAVQDGAVGKRYSQPFSHYMRNVLPELVARDRLHWHAWYLSAYVLGQLQQRMTPERLAAAVAVASGDMPHHAVAAGGFEYRRCAVDDLGSVVEVVGHLRRHSVEWVRSCEIEAQRLVRTHYLPYDRPRPPRRQSAREARQDRHERQGATVSPVEAVTP